MSIRNLDALFDPKVIAVVGASNRPHSVGAVLAQNMAAGGFTGTLLAVNPRLDSGLPMPSYRSVADLPVAPDLAVLATPPATVAPLIAELGAKGCRAAVVLTAGFGEGESATGAELRAAMLAAARPHLLRIVGPNCLGFVSPAKHVNASFAHVFPPPGEIAVVAQSGAVAAAVMDWAAARGIGLSHVISVGDMADVDFGDLLDMLALDHHTRAILLYVEAIVDARKFMSAARIAARIKPVIVVKAGRSAAGAHAALSHTGALAGSDIVYDAAFRRAGLLRVTELRELFDAVAMLSSGIRVAGDRLAILTNGGGLGVLAADAIDLAQGKLAPLPPATVEALNAVLPSTWSHRNPVDIIGDATGERYVRALNVLVKNPECDAVLVMNVPTAVSDSLAAAQAVAAAIPTDPPLPLLSCWVGDGPAAEARAVLARKRVPAFETPDDAVRGVHAAGQLPPQSGGPARDAAGRAGAGTSAAPGGGRRDRRRARGEAHAPVGARGEGAAGGIRHSGRGKPRRRRRRRGRPDCRGAWRRGCPEDPVAGPHPQVGRRRRPPGPARRRGRCQRRARDAGHGAGTRAKGAPRRIHRRTDGAPVGRSRAAPRHRQRPDLRAGDPVRLRRDGGRGDRRPGDRPAAAQPGAGAQSHPRDAGSRACFPGIAAGRRRSTRSPRCWCSCRRW